MLVLSISHPTRGWSLQRRCSCIDRRLGRMLLQAKAFHWKIRSRTSRTVGRRHACAHACLPRVSSATTKVEARGCDRLDVLGGLGRRQRGQSETGRSCRTRTCARMDAAKAWRDVGAIADRVHELLPRLCCVRSAFRTHSRRSWRRSDAMRRRAACRKRRCRRVWTTS